MACAVLFSGGKDSALAALYCEPSFDVTLVTGTFAHRERLPARGGDDGEGHQPTVADRIRAGDAAVGPVASERAAALGLPHETVPLDPTVAERAVDRLVADGFPRNAIQAVHEHALERVAGAGDYDVVADGTRRDDRAPRLDRPAAQSLEDRHDVAYARPLAGFGADLVDALADRHLRVDRGPSDAMATADYETELRALLRAREHASGAVGTDVEEEACAAAVERIFPDHEQSVVRGRTGDGGVGAGAGDIDVR